MANVIRIGGGGSGGSATLITKSITQNGTYSAQDDNADGYSEVEVDVAGSEIDKVYFQATSTRGATPLTITLLETANKTSHIKLTGSVWAPSIPTGYTATTGTISNNSFTTTETSEYHWDYVQEFDITCGDNNAVIVYNGELNFKSEVSLDVYHIYNLASKTITQNGTYNASADSADGYNPVIVNVSGGGGIDYLESWIINSKSAVNISTTTTHLVYTNGEISAFENADNAGNETVTLGDISTFIGDASGFYWWVTANANMTYRIYNVLTGTLGALQTAQSGDRIISDGTIDTDYCMEIRRYS